MLARLAALFLALASVGCVYSHRDIAEDIDPSFPLADGVYVNAEGERFELRREGDRYKAILPDGQQPEIAVFRIVEDHRYAIRLNTQSMGAGGDPAAPLYAYFFAELVDDTWMLLRLPSNAIDAMPGETAALLLQDETDDSGYGVRDEQATLDVLRLVLDQVPLDIFTTLDPAE